MLSCWSVMYAGPQHGGFIKKLERLASIKALELEKERFIWDGEKIEHASFLVQHAAQTWPELVMELLHTSKLIFPVWLITMGESAPESFAGKTSRHIEGPGIEYTMPISGHRIMKWEINAEEKYERMRWLNGGPDRW